VTAAVFGRTSTTAGEAEAEAPPSFFDASPTFGSNRASTRAVPLLAVGGLVRVVVDEHDVRCVAPEVRRQGLDRVPLVPSLVQALLSECF
jgi:hypothetical protein